ncbi:MAG: CFI-box-CTERM domain-containing protein [Minisyncoccota bacterium]
MGIFSSHAEDHNAEVEKAHNDGQIDSSNGEYKAPYGVVARSVPFVSIATTEEMNEVNEAYDKGHSHAESQKGGCFLTTACVEYAGLADDCHELTVLRSFRDNYIAHLVRGPAILAEYYEVAPALVQKIEQDANRETILSDIFATVKKAVELIEGEKHTEAFNHYEAMFVDLKKRFHSLK